MEVGKSLYDKDLNLQKPWKSSKLEFLTIIIDKLKNLGKDIFHLDLKLKGAYAECQVRFHKLISAGKEKDYRL